MAEASEGSTGGQRPRKISLPLWFRQSSFGLGSGSRGRLPKQHTIAVPPQGEPEPHDKVGGVHSVGDVVKHDEIFL